MIAFLACAYIFKFKAYHPRFLTKEDVLNNDFLDIMEVPIRFLMIYSILGFNTLIIFVSFRFNIGTNVYDPIMMVLLVLHFVQIISSFSIFFFDGIKAGRFLLTVHIASALIYLYVFIHFMILTFKYKADTTSVSQWISVELFVYVASYF